MADLKTKQVAMAKAYSTYFANFLKAYYVLVNEIGRVADAPITWDDTTLHGDPSLAYVDAAMIVKAEALMNQLATYLGQVPAGETLTRRAILEAITPQ